MRDMAMVPGYHAIYGKKCVLDDLLGIVKQFAVEDWLLHLSRLASLLAGSRHRPGEYADAFFRYIVPESTLPKIASWFHDANARGNRALIFHDRHVGILIELALIHAPRHSEKKLGPEGHLLNALLMLIDLDTPPELPQTDEQWAALIAGLWERSRLVDPICTTTRGFMLYNIASDSPTERACEWADLFRRASGSSLEAYFLGGLSVLALELTKSPDEIARTFAPYPEKFTAGDGKMLHGVPDAYFDRRCADVEELSRFTREQETYTNPNEFDLLALLKYPLFRHASGVRSLFLSGMAVSLCDGIYHEVMTASLESKIQQKPQDVGSVFGYLFEDYILDLLEEFFPTRLLKKPLRTDNRQEAADGAIICPEGVIVLQIKGRHIRATSRFAWKSREAREDEVKRTGLVQAVDQFVEKESLLSFRHGLVDGLPFPSASDMVLQPVVITYERVPLSGSLLPVVKEQRARTEIDAHTRPLIIMNVAEVEAVCSLSGADTIWGVLTEFVRSPGWEQRNLTNFLYDTNRLSDRAMLSRWERILPMLQDRFGLSP